MWYLFTSILVPALTVGALGGVVIWGVYNIRRDKQGQASHMRKTLEIQFGGEMKPEDVMGVFHAWSGLDRPKWLDAVHPVSLEVYGTGGTSLRYFINVAGHQAERMEKWLTHMLRVEIDEVEEADDPISNHLFDYALELEAGTGKLDIVDPIQQARAIAAMFEDLVEGEELGMQIIVIPAGRSEDDKYNNFNAVLRVAGSRPERPELMVLDVVSALKALDNEKVHFKKRLISNVPQRFAKREAMMEFPNVFNEQELITLSLWPFDGSPVKKAKRLPPNKAHDLWTPGAPVVPIGISNSTRTKGQVVGISQEGMFRHGYLIGGTGAGKTRQLENVILGAMDVGMSVVVIGPDPGLIMRVADRIPADRIKDTILFDPGGDPMWPVPINVMAGDFPERTRGHIVEMLYSIQPDSWGTRVERIIRTVAYTAALTDDSFYGMWALLSNKHYRETQLKKVPKDRFPMVHEEWEWIAGLPENALDAPMNRISSIIGYEPVRNTVAINDGLNFDNILASGKNLLASLPIGSLSEPGAAALGRIIFDQVWDAAIKVPEDKARPSLVAIDEFQHYSSYDSLTARFSEGRKYKQSYWVAHQYVKQIDEKVMESIKMNVKNPQVFQLQPEDAKRAAPLFPPMSADDIAALPDRTVVARTYGPQGYSSAVTLKTIDSRPPTGSLAAVRANTREFFAKPVSEIEAAINRKHATAPANKLPRFTRGGSE